MPGREEEEEEEDDDPLVDFEVEQQRATEDDDIGDDINDDIGGGPSAGGQDLRPRREPDTVVAYAAKKGRQIRTLLDGAAEEVMRPVVKRLVKEHVKEPVKGVDRPRREQKLPVRLRKDYVLDVVDRKPQQQ